MGVDVVMKFRVPGGISDEELRNADWELPATVGHSYFWTIGEENICLSEDDEGWIDIALYGRLYTEGYERGPLLVYLAVADWIEKRFPGVEILYGGDSGDNLVSFDKEYRSKLYDYWLENGNQPYERYFSEGYKDVKGCKRCINGLVYYGGSIETSLFRCLACGDKFTERDGELTKDELF